MTARGNIFRMDEHPDYYIDDECEFTEDEMEDAKLELKLEQLEAQEREYLELWEYKSKTRGD